MSKNYAVAVLDIGTTGVRMLVGRVGETGTPKIIAKADCSCRGGIKRIDEYDRGGIPDAISNVLDSIKMKTGLDVRSCYVNLRNDYVYTVNNAGSVNIKEDSDCITAGDIGELLNDASAIDLNDDERLIDVIPLMYYVDGKASKERPEGVPGNRLSVDSNVVLAKNSKLEKVEKILKDAGLSVDGYVPSFFSEQKVLPSAYFNKTAGKPCFALVADVGGDFTEYSLFYNGIPFSFGLHNFGGNSITKDLSIVLNISMNEAERLKLDYPIASSVTPGTDVEIAIFPLEKGEKEMVNVSYVVEIMQARLKEIASNVIDCAKKDLINMGISTPFIDRIVFVGEGIARFSGIREALEDVAGGAELEVLNIGRDIGMKNSYSVATGMLLYIAPNLKYGRSPSRIVKEVTEEKHEEQEQKKSFVASVADKIKSWFSLFKE